MRIRKTDEEIALQYTTWNGYDAWVAYDDDGNRVGTYPTEGAAVRAARFHNERVALRRRRAAMKDR